MFSFSGSSLGSGAPPQAPSLFSGFRQPSNSGENTTVPVPSTLQRSSSQPPSSGSDGGFGERPLFGNSPPSLFGNSSAPPPIPSAGSLFGRAGAPAPAAPGSRFGNAQVPPPPPPPGGLFGGIPSRPSSGNGIFDSLRRQSSSAPQQSVWETSKSNSSGGTLMSDWERQRQIIIDRMPM